jgi:dienelactone hydrolase
MPAQHKAFISLAIAMVTVLACLSEFGIPQPIDQPTQPLTATFTATATAIPPSVTNISTSTPLPPTETSTPVFVPSQSRIRVTFVAEDGRPLVGYFYSAWKPNAPVVVLMHQFEGNQAMWQESPLIKWLRNWPVPINPASPTPSANGLLPIMPADLSFAVFTFDFRGHGESLPADIIPDGYQAHANEFLMDARAAYQVARQMPNVDPSKIIGLGTSIGGDAVVDACGEGCVGAFSISPGSWLNVDYGEAVQKLIAAGKFVRCMYSVNDPPTPATCLSVSPDEHYKIFGYLGMKHGMTFVVLPRKMEADFGTHLLDFLMEAIQ